MMSKPPFTKEIIEEPLLNKFKMAQFKHSNGTMDRVDQVDSFKALMLSLGATDTIMCWAAPTTLKKIARFWYSNLRHSSIESFNPLATNSLATSSTAEGREKLQQPLFPSSREKISLFKAISTGQCRDAGSTQVRSLDHSSCSNERIESLALWLLTGEKASHGLGRTPNLDEQVHPS